MSMSSSFLLVVFAMVASTSDKPEVLAASVLCVAMTIIGDEICKAIKEKP